VRLGGDGRGDLGEVQVHRLGVGARQHQRGTDPTGRADRAEEVGPLVAGVAYRPGPRAALRPDPGQRALLADAGLVLEPDLERPAPRGLRQRRRYRFGEVFLNASCAAGSALRCRGRGFSRV
jgi:hypothetical protein